MTFFRERELSGENLSHNTVNALKLAVSPQQWMIVHRVLVIC